MLTDTGRQSPRRPSLVYRRLVVIILRLGVRNPQILRWIVTSVTLTLVSGPAKLKPRPSSIKGQGFSLCLSRVHKWLIAPVFFMDFDFDVGTRRSPGSSQRTWVSVDDGGTGPAFLKQPGKRLAITTQVSENGSIMACSRHVFFSGVIRRQ